ncbi:sulfotransferase family protein [Mycobacterium paraense]|nr:sulfotransferase [Mycobacterium paraense]
MCLQHYRPRHPVFIVGSVRSGTSALADVLWNIGYEGFGEGHFLSLIHYIEAIVDQHYDRFPTDPGVLLGNIDKCDLKHRLFEPFRTMMNDLMNDLNQKEFWFDKTADPGMILASPIVRELWPNSVFVFAKRRGIENVISRVKKFPGESFENHCAGWAGSMAEWRNVRQQLPPGCFIEVEQRDMSQQPERTARSLCAFLGWDGWDDVAVQRACDALSTHRPEESAQGSASKTLSLAESGWTAEQTEMFLKYCETEMKEFGYTLDEHYSATP